MQNKNSKTTISILIILIAIAAGYFLLYQPNHTIEVLSEYPIDPYDQPLVASEDIAMVDFFDSLEQKNYDLAIPLFDGLYNQLREWNPEVSYYDLGTLWKQGCEMNGLNCLKIKEILSKENVDPIAIFKDDVLDSWSDKAGKYTKVYKYTVTFKNDDGTLFEVGPCCGQEDDSRVSEFDVLVGQNDKGSFIFSYPPSTP